jgi:hypothetical protein
MPGELRTYVFAAVVSMLLGAGIGFGWHYFADSAGATTIASAVTAPAKQDAPGPALVCPPGPREGAVPDVPGSPVLSRPNNQPDPAHSRGALRVTHARTHPPRPIGASSRPTS